MVGDVALTEVVGLLEWEGCGVPVVRLAVPDGVDSVEMKRPGRPRRRPWCWDATEHELPGQERNVISFRLVTAARRER